MVSSQMLLSEVKRYIEGLNSINQEVLEKKGKKPEKSQNQSMAEIRKKKKNNKIKNEMDQEILEIIDEVISHSRPQFLLSFFPINVSMELSQIVLKNSDIVFKSQDLTNLLKKSTQCGIVAVTLGYKIDQQIAYYNKFDLAHGIIYDAAASAYVEAVCDEKQRSAEKPYNDKGMQFTFRFSPGYGDLSLNVQPIILSLLQAPVKIGLSVSKFYTLFPRKSMTGIFGIIPIKVSDDNTDSDSISELIQRPKKIDHPKCHTCLNYSHCIYLSEGTYCEYRKRNL
ncbi:hypothetical protein [Candidatus Harpocratesius sp.]